MRPVEPSGSRPVGHSARMQRVAQSSSGEEGIEEETEVPESDADDTLRRPKDHGAKSRGVPQRGSHRPTPCSRCVRLGRDCYDQVNGKNACYACGRGKVRCETGDFIQGARPKKGKRPARNEAPSATGEESSPRRFTRAEKGKSKGECGVSLYINLTTKL